MCKTCIVKFEAEFYECSHFHNSDEDLCEFRPTTQILRLQNLHQKNKFLQNYANCSYSISFVKVSKLKENQTS